MIANKNIIDDIAPLIIQLWEDNSIDEAKEILMEYIDSDEMEVFTHSVEGKYVGLALCSLRHDYVEGCDSTPVGYLEGIVVDEQFRKIGIGNMLCQECEQWAKNKGCLEFASDCELDNNQSLKFHLGIGFKEENRIICFKKNLNSVIEENNEELFIELQDVEWPLEYIDHDRQIVRAIVFDDNGCYYFVRAIRDDDFGKATLIETSGGGVESNEDLLTAIRRELKEELGVSVEIIYKLGVVSDYYNLIHRHNINHYFLCKITGFGEQNLTREEKEDFNLSILKMNYEEAVKEYEKCSDTKLGRLVANRELPILHHAKDIIEKMRYGAMYNKIQQIINEWDLNEKEVEQIYDSAWQVGEHAVLKKYKDVNMLQRNIKILTILEGMGIPVGGIVLTKDKKTYVKDADYFYILTNKLSGRNITDIHKNTVIASEMGRVLARLHKAFKKCETQDEFWNNSLLKEMKSWIKDVFAKNNWKYIEEDNFNETVEILEKLYDKLPVQLIHRDVHLGNFLFDKGRFSGYIDFDLSQRNIRIFDLCYFMLGLLSEEELLDITEEQWFNILKHFFEGYEQECKLQEEEKQAVPYVMESIELLFVAWFMEQSDIKCAEDAIKIYQFVEKNAERILKIID